jgi:hypothetical protein
LLGNLGKRGRAARRAVLDRGKEPLLELAGRGGRLAYLEVALGVEQEAVGEGSTGVSKDRMEGRCRTDGEPLCRDPDQSGNQHPSILEHSEHVQSWQLLAKRCLPVAAMARSRGVRSCLRVFSGYR